MRPIGLTFRTQNGDTIEVELLPSGWAILRVMGIDDAYSATATFQPGEITDLAEQLARLPLRIEPTEA